MNTLRLFFDFEFTSLSPDAQPISLGIVSEDLGNGIIPQMLGEPKVMCKSFYAEFTDFDIERCDDWVKENVVSKLRHYHLPKKGEEFCHNLNNISILGNTKNIIKALKEWLSQFSDFQIDFVCDCGSYDWYHLLQLIGEWSTINYCCYLRNSCVMTDNSKDWSFLNCPNKNYFEKENIKSPFTCNALFKLKTGLPKLPPNISPVPFDLNDLIAIKKGISVKEAFELDRYKIMELPRLSSKEFIPDEVKNIDFEVFARHNALSDAKVIKSIYEKLKM